MTVLALLIGGFGSLVGSFLNVVVYRVPRKLSVVAPPSACPNCGAHIRARDNIPVLSWLILRARCRDCGAPISARYPLVELGTAIAFVPVAFLLLPAVLGATSVTATVAAAILLGAYLYLAASTFALALIDRELRVLPNRIVLPSIIVLLVAFIAASALSGDWLSLARAAAGGGILFAFYFILATVTRGGMGFGDVKLAALLGLAAAWFGWPALIVAAFASFALGGIFGLVLIATRRVGRRSAIPFGPWMIVGAWIGIFFGTTIWGGYLHAFGVA